MLQYTVLFASICTLCICQETLASHSLPVIKQHQVKLHQFPISNVNCNWTSVKQQCRVHEQEYLSQVLKTSSSELDNLKQKAFKNVSELHTLISSAQSVDALTTANKHISNAISVFKTLECANELPNIPVRKQPSPNALAEKQTHFYSTKKREKLPNAGQSLPVMRL